jgi:hypothetical protein
MLSYVSALFSILPHPSVLLRTPTYDTTLFRTLAYSSVLLRTLRLSSPTLRTLFDFKTLFPRWNGEFMKQKEKGYEAELWQVVSYPRLC